MPTLSVSVPIQTADSAMIPTRTAAGKMAGTIIGMIIGMMKIPKTKCIKMMNRFPGTTR